MATAPFKASSIYDKQVPYQANHVSLMSTQRQEDMLT